MHERLCSALIASMIFTGSFMAAQAANADEQAKSGKRGAYGLYTSLGCTRSFRKQASYDTLSEASAAADRFRKSRELVWVATGSESYAYNLHPRFRDSLQLEGGCSVYLKQCRSGIQLHKKTKTAKEAEALAKKLGSTQNVEIVYHLPTAKPKS